MKICEQQGKSMNINDNRRQNAKLDENQRTSANIREHLRKSAKMLGNLGKICEFPRKSVKICEIQLTSAKAARYSLTGRLFKWTVPLLLEGSPDFAPNPTEDPRSRARVLAASATSGDRPGRIRKIRGKSWQNPQDPTKPV